MEPEGYYIATYFTYISNITSAHWTHNLLIGIVCDEKMPAMRFTVQHMRIKNNEASNGKTYLQTMCTQLCSFACYRSTGGAGTA
jgi:hypothetical protein